MNATCRFCSAPLEAVFADLGMSPMANSYVAPERANAMEPFYPLKAWVCGECKLVQLEEYETPDEIFSDYAYFSAFSSSWLEHSERYVEAMIERFGFDGSSQVVEVASNDGYLLQYFVQRGVPVLGIEPAANVAPAAEERGVRTLVKFFGVETATEVAKERKADLLLGNNVLAHVPDINDFVGGLKALLADGGVITIEFPHLLRLVEELQWDTIYHEHFSYLSFSTVARIFAAHGLKLWDVEELPTHGGSLRIFGAHADDDAKAQTDRATEMLEREAAAGFDDVATYTAFNERVQSDKRQILEFLIEQKRAGRRMVGYGAAAKGNTLLNFCAVREDFLDYVVDLNPAKQDHLLPGTHIPIRSPDVLKEDRPDLVVILPWNLRDEIVREHAYVREWGGRFAARAPELQLLP
jgi:SAM-dependent methyltransferase